MHGSAFSHGPNMAMLTFLLTMLSLAPVAAGQSVVETPRLLWQTNAGGDDVHLYDIDSGDLVRHFKVGDHPHGIATAPGSDTVFVSLERNDDPTGVLLWIDKNTFEIRHRLEVGPQPHAIAVTPDGRWVYVPCRDGFYWVVDAEKRVVVDRIHTGGRPHNTTVSPRDGLVYLSPMGRPGRVTIVNPQNGHEVAGEIRFSDSVRPPAIAPSRDLFFQHVDGLNGFEVADLVTRERTARIEHSGGLGLPFWPKSLGFLSFGGFNRCHGLAVRPGENEIWSVCGSTATVHAITSADFPERARIALPSKGYWLTFSPDGKHAFVALSNRSEVAMIDADAGEVIRTFAAGRKPKRNLVVSADGAAPPSRSPQGLTDTP